MPCTSFTMLEQPVPLGLSSIGIKKLLLKTQVVSWTSSCIVKWIYYTIYYSTKSRWTKQHIFGSLNLNIKSVSLYQLYFFRSIFSFMCSFMSNGAFLTPFCAILNHNIWFNTNYSLNETERTIKHHMFHPGKVLWTSALKKLTFCLVWKVATPDILASCATAIAKTKHNNTG